MHLELKCLGDVLKNHRLESADNIELEGSIRYIRNGY